ncbi:MULTISPECIES: YjjG family noncanonical pyrimidine nucleotidase [Jeotgalicoccus]|jgi:HAD superfamily (subfamily IA) hydrolase, TIGR02254|uniref:Noncanonical pyrimidine nucleotidase, YjjG family n=1 Tax=Jeotgalicoccus nanhaiensis TaxID=568603 RepID=A0ABR9XZ10_9STAP|nr:YjjG family noncanonical pyrimidine nucleotidase [Jeotgalicoccus nanhaiensis]MBF0753966.1 noncanonical pyrimidine nucleotidase, YjjG family [Jeotgalicoccus nanhaiensis]TFU62119.1 noncanonical pyrimidine nucleotidase, YjjG family [Jeotgalicoccus nanhaiensis]
MYKAVFLDIDDTVFNFKKCSESALKGTFSTLNIEYNKGVFESFAEIDERLWKQQKEEVLSVADVMNIRFKELSESLNMDFDSDLAKAHFGNLLGEQHIMEPGIEEMLRKISADCKIYAASNGVLTMQENRLKLSGLKRYFTDLFVSDDLGHAKPDISFFTKSMKRADLYPNEILMVGDSLVSDIAGAHNAGIDSVWYNPYRLENDSQIQADYEINHLHDLSYCFKS